MYLVRNIEKIMTIQTSLNDLKDFPFSINLLETFMNHTIIRN